MLPPCSAREHYNIGTCPWYASKGGWWRSSRWDANALIYFFQRRLKCCACFCESLKAICCGRALWEGEILLCWIHVTKKPPCWPTKIPCWADTNPIISLQIPHSGMLCVYLPSRNAPTPTVLFCMCALYLYIKIKININLTCMELMSKNYHRIPSRRLFLKSSALQTGGQQCTPFRIYMS